MLCSCKHALTKLCEVIYKKVKSIILFFHIYIPINKKTKFAKNQSPYFHDPNLVCVNS